MSDETKNDQNETLSPETQKELNAIRAQAIRYAAQFAVQGKFCSPANAADVLAKRLKWDSASGTVIGGDGRSLDDHVQELYEMATGRGETPPREPMMTRLGKPALCKQDLATPDEKSAFITQHGFDAWERLPAFLPQGDGQILSKADLKTPQAKAKFIGAHGYDAFEKLPLRRNS